MIKLEIYRVSSDHECDTNIEKVQSASKKIMETEAGIGTKSHYKKVCEQDLEAFYLWTNLMMGIIDITATQLGLG